MLKDVGMTVPKTIEMNPLKCRTLVQKLWPHLLTVTAYEGTGAIDIPYTFLMAVPSKCPKKANNRQNATWNTTQCKATRTCSFPLVSVF